MAAATRPAPPHRSDGREAGFRAFGFTVLAEEHREPSDTVDLLGAVWLSLNAVIPPDDAPSLPRPPGRARWLLRCALLIAAVPALALATALDRLLLKPLAGRGKVSNAYRVVARCDATARPGPR
ncbi:hypothetical protein AB0G77_11765 [Streptomyces hygroscopicus]|uniref:hypothetical protein n=1 Tax=Streptomyces hygroscopicus TaxID=1912 RepID=UPI0033EF84CD